MGINSSASDVRVTTMLDFRALLPHELFDDHGCDASQCSFPNRAAAHAAEELSHHAGILLVHLRRHLCEVSRSLIRVSHANATWRNARHIIALVHHLPGAPHLEGVLVLRHHPGARPGHQPRLHRLERRGQEHSAV